MFKSRRVWIAVGISVLFLVWFFAQFDVRDMWGNLGKADYKLLIPAVCAYFVAVLFRSIRWQYLMAPVKELSVRRLYPVVVVGYMANNILPIRLGELVRSYYLGERESVSKVSTLATIAVERVFDGLTLLFFAAVVSFSLPLASFLEELSSDLGVHWLIIVLVTSLPFLVSAVIMTFAACLPSQFQVVINMVTAILPARFRGRVSGLIQMFVNGLVALNHPGKLAYVFVLSVPVWLLEAIMYYIIALSFDLHGVFGTVDLIAVILMVTAISNLAISIPAAGGGVGTFEVAAASTLTILGVDEALAAAYTIALHVALLLPVTLAGIIYLWFDKVSIGELARESQAESDTAEHGLTQNTEEVI